MEQTPDILNETYKNGGVFDKDLIHYWSIPNVFPQIKCDEFLNYYDKPAPIEKFYNYLDRGLPVIVLVDFDCNPNNGVDSHFVVLSGYDDETKDFFCIDPWTGEEYFFKAKYGDPATFIYGHRLYSWEVTHEISCEEKNEKLSAEVQKLNELSENQGFEIGHLKTELEKETIGKDLAIKEANQERAKAVEANSERVKRERELNQVIEKQAKEVKKKDKRLSSQDIKIEGLRSELTVLMDTKAKDLSMLTLLKFIILKLRRKNEV